MEAPKTIEKLKEEMAEVTEKINALTYKLEQNTIGYNRLVKIRSNIQAQVSKNTYNKVIQDRKDLIDKLQAELTAAEATLSKLRWAHINATSPSLHEAYGKR
jgi:chromosome segregation ATPase